MLPTSLLSLLALVTVVVAEPAHIPLTRRSSPLRRDDGSVDPARLAKARDFLQHRYGAKSSSARKRAGQTVGVPIINSNVDSSYIGAVTVGTPGQSFNVVLDTGSSDLWLASSNCASCNGVPTFNPADSSSLQQPSTTTGQSQRVQIQYGSGAVAGTLAQDIVNMNGFTVNPQTFLVVNQMTDGLLDGETSGIIGLAFQALASTQAVPFWQALLNAGQFAQPEMSFFLTRFLDDRSASNSEPGGFLTLGGTNSTLFTGDIEFLDLASTESVNSATFWLLEVSGVNVNGKSVQVSTSSALAAIDTGTTLIGGPSDGVQAIWSAVPGSQPLSGQMEGFFAFPCASSVKVSLSFGGKFWPISTDDMNLGTVSSGMCLGGIFDLGLGSNIGSGGGNPSWVVGDTFLKNVYSVFRANPPSVGFAQLSTAAGGSDAPSDGTEASATITATNVPVSTGASGSNPTATGANSAATLSVPSGTFGFAMCVALSVASALSLFAA